MSAAARPTDRSEVALHVARPDEWRRWREIRLRSLQQDPDAFGSTYERELAHTEDDWRLRLAAGRSVIAAVGGVDVGLGAGFEDTPGKLMVVAMWTDPGSRGRGVGRAVLEHVVRSAQADGLHAHLWVADGNPARRLYESAGFAADGRIEPLREGSPLTMRHLVLDRPV